MKQILKIILRYSYLVVIVIGFMTLGSIGDLWLPNLSRIILDQGIMQGDFDALWQAGLAMLAVALGIITVAFLGHYFDAKLGSLFSRDLRDILYRKIMKFSQVEYDHLSSSSLITRTTNDVQHLQSFFMMILRMGVRAPAMAIGGILMSLALSPELTMILLGGVVILAVIITIVARALTPYSMKVQQGIDKINEVLREKLTGVRVIRAFNTTEIEQNRFAKASDDLRQVNVTLQRIQALFNPTFNLVINVTILGMILLGKDAVANDVLSIGSLAAMLSYAQMILFSVIMLTMLMMQLPRATAALKRITEVLDQKLAIVDRENQTVLKRDAVVRFEHVYFRYPGSQKDVLSDINLAIQPHQMTAIIGSTGSGKSTIAKLMLRFYEVSAGRITIDGIDIRDLSLKTLHDFFGYVPQKASLFSGTIASNIRYSNPALSDEAIRLAAQISHAEEFILEKEIGYDDQVAQAATNLSGGQKQRLSIARAIAKTPPYYIFDDAFSALDYRTDQRVRKALFQLSSDASFIVVAQRVNTIRQAEHIIVLNDGQVVGEGRHEELMQANTTYQEIVLSQLSKEEATHESTTK